MINLTLFDYFRWFKRHWLASALYLAVAGVSAYLYANQLPKLYRATVAFSFTPEVYQQGTLRRIDDFVLSQHQPRMNSTELTRRAEIRPAFYTSSEAFKRQVSKMLRNDFNADFDALADHELLPFVRQHLHYYRFELDQFHVLQWHHTNRKQASAHLEAIIHLLNAELTADLIDGLSIQINKLKEIEQRSDLNHEFRNILAVQQAIAGARYNLLTNPDFKLIQLHSNYDVGPGPVYPKRTIVMFVVVVVWGVLGITLVNIFLIRAARIK